MKVRGLSTGWPSCGVIIHCYTRAGELDGVWSMCAISRRCHLPCWRTRIAEYNLDGRGIHLRGGKLPLELLHRRTVGPRDEKRSSSARRQQQRGTEMCLMVLRMCIPLPDRVMGRPPWPGGEEIWADSMLTCVKEGKICEGRRPTCLVLGRWNGARQALLMVLDLPGTCARGPQWRRHHTGNSTRSLANVRNVMGCSVHVDDVGMAARDRGITGGIHPSSCGEGSAMICASTHCLSPPDVTGHQWFSQVSEANITVSSTLLQHMGRLRLLGRRGG